MCVAGVQVGVSVCGGCVCASMRCMCICVMCLCCVCDIQAGASVTMDVTRCETSDPLILTFLMEKWRQNFVGTKKLNDPVLCMYDFC
jgi:hypothetical protein